MDCTEAEESYAPVEDFGVQDRIQSSDNFQKFIYELFDKNGIINDLRAYLRGHIINILKNAETGDLPVCQKNFAQRLELPFQALNILIIEYLLNMEFNYTLSVFISEVPLANMVFNFTKSLLNPETEPKVSNLRFEDGDIWSILNCIGLKCSSEHAMKIVEMYKNEKRPLLFCILKCVSFYQGVPVISDQSSDTLDEKVDEHSSLSYKCKHYVFCKACQYRVARLKEKYKWKKAKAAQNAKSENIKKVNVETFMSNVNVLEQTLIDEMFQELKSVYETEIEMVKEEQQKRLKHSIASHALQLQSYKEKMEKSFQARESELSQAIQQKKRFLWGLAKNLREQHENLTRAMRGVREQSDRLTQKESSLKIQLKEAENELKKRGEDMRQQISDELVILEENLATMKRERDLINEERKGLEDDDSPKNYDVIKNELVILRRYLENLKSEKKCLIDRSTITEFGGRYMNNECIRNKMATQLVNDLKKHKNVNFIQSNFEEIYNVSGRQSTVSSEGTVIEIEESRNDCRMDVRDRDKSRSRRYTGSRDNVARDQFREELGDVRGLDVEDLRQENNRLKSFARQQRDYIQALVNERDRLERALSAPSRPRTAPSVPDSTVGTRINVSPSVMLSRRLTDDERRVVSDPWRPRHESDVTEPSNTRVSQEVSSIRPERDIVYHQFNSEPRATYQTFPEPGKQREKSPKSMLREAKERLRNSTMKPNQQPDVAREKSPTATLREAKLRLRKLEIEAEAVEKSYQDFRRRQHELREERECLSLARCDIDGQIDKIDVKPKPYGIYGRNYKKDPRLTNETPESMKKDFDKYLREYNTKFDLNRLRFNNKNSVLENVKPIPTSFSDRKVVNLLETPITEFRKFYQVDSRSKLNKNVQSLDTAEISESEMSKISESRKINDKNETWRQQDDTINFVTNNCDAVRLQTNSCKTSPKNEVLDQAKESVRNRNNKAAKPQNTMESKRRDSFDISIKENSPNKPKSLGNNDIFPQTRHQNENDESQASELKVNKVSETRIKEIKSPKRFKGTSHEPTNQINENQKIENNIRIHKQIEEENNNLLVVEVESARNNIIVPEKNHEFLVVIESSVDDRDLLDEDEPKYPISVIVSPKNTDGPKGYESDDKKLSSVDMQLELSKEKVESISEVEKDLDEYMDDFSADVDNYNNTSDNGNNSPISLPKNSEDDKFWNS